VKMVEAVEVEKWERGYRDGVWLVPITRSEPWGGAVQRFFTSIVPTKGRIMYGRWEARRPGEKPVMVRTVAGDKTRANFVAIVLYEDWVLAEDNERSTDKKYEIISINASPLDKDVPMTPETMKRNMNHEAGGTKGTYTDEEFAESEAFWKAHAMVER